MRTLLVTALFMGCGPKVPVSPPMPSEAFAVDREALPGGHLRVFHTATVGMSEREGLAGGRKTDWRAPVSVALFDHPTHGVVLIDAGFGRATATDPPTYPVGLGLKLLDVGDVVPLVDVLDQVELSAADVRQVFVTHLHVDHVGGIADLPAAVVRAPQMEWDAAQQRRVTKGYDPAPYLANAFAPVVFDDGPVGPFAHSADIFGDGSLVALSTPGHTVGHTMYLVNLPHGSWLFTGDAAWIDANWLEGARPKGWLARSLLEDNWKLGASALWRIHWFAQQEGVTVISGHEPANLERLPAWPATL